MGDLIGGANGLHAVPAVVVVVVADVVTFSHGPENESLTRHEDQRMS